MGALGSERIVWDVLRRLAPHLLTYLMSFLTLGIFWVGQQTQLNQFRRSDRDLTWIHLVFLLGVSLMPFSTMLLADYLTYRLAVAVYWLNIVLLGALLYASMRYARRASLTKEDVTAEMTAAAERRIIAYQALYAFGALLSVLSTYLSIGFIFVVQLNAAIAPRIWWLDRFLGRRAGHHPPRPAAAGSWHSRHAPMIHLCMAINVPEFHNTAVQIGGDVRAGRLSADGLDVHPDEKGRKWRCAGSRAVASSGRSGQPAQTWERLGKWQWACRASGTARPRSA